MKIKGEANEMNTYWNRTGKYQKLVEQLNELIPDWGEIKGSKNYQLERFRKASNAYYDIFNNGGGNRHTISKWFGSEVTFRLDQLRQNRRCFMMDNGWELIHTVTEPKMDEIVLAAAKEQGFC